MNILVTGGAGYIGSHVAKRLVKDGHSVVVVDNLSNSNKDRLKDLFEIQQFTFYEFDVNNTFKLRGVFDSHHFDMVYHFAGNADTRKGEESPYADIENTLQTTLNILEMMRVFEVRKFFFASSSNVYGNIDERLQENRSIMCPISHYGAGKLASEAFVCSFSSLHNFQAWIARFSNTVGPNMNRGVIPDLIRKIKLHPKELEVYGNGTQTKPYIYIDDLVEGVMYLVDRTNEDVNTYLIGVESNVTVDRIAHIVMEEFNINIPIHYVEEYEGNKGDVLRYSYDVTRLRMLGWTPKYTAEEAIRKAIQLNKDS